MSSVIIAGNTSGTITLDAPNVAGTTTLTLPTTSGTIVTSANISSNLPTGSVLQVVSATKTDTATTTGTSFVDITGLSVSITPSSASNKVLIIFNAYISNATAGTRFAARLVRNSTNIAIADAAGSRTQATTGGCTVNATNGEMWGNSMNFLDSPATTSSTTYKIQYASIDGGTTVINRGSGDPDSTSILRTVSSITVMEIKG